MLETIKKYFTSISKVCVLEQITFEGKIEYNYVELSAVKNELKILKQETILNIESFKKLNSNNLPVILNVNGFNTLTKVNPSNLEAFENEKFIFNCSIIDDNTYYNIVRRDSISDTLNYLENNSYLIVDICVGAFNIKKYQDLFIKNINPEPHSFKLENDLLYYSFERKDKFIYKKINIGENELPTNLMSPLTTGLDYLLNTQFNKNTNDFSFSRIESVFSKHLKTTLIIFVGVLLTSLFTNYFYQNHLSNKYKDSEYKSAVLEEKKSQIEILESSIQEKERVFNEYGLSSDLQFAEYLDVLAYLLPNKVGLNSLAINPLKKEMKDGKKIKLISNKIFISGTVDEIETLNKYLIKIESHALFNRAKIVVFTQETSFAKFKLEVAI
jgi:Tfp pilus assembly protein PilN